MSEKELFEAMDDALPSCLTGNSRRTFMKKAGSVIALGTMGLYQAGCDSPVAPDTDFPAGSVVYSNNQVTIDLALLTDLKQEGSFAYIGTLDGQSVNVIVVNDASTYRAFSSRCTHDGYPVNQFDPSSGEMRCPTHNAFYDLSGDVLRGPARRSLEVYSITQTEDVLTVQLA